MMASGAIGVHPSMAGVGQVNMNLHTYTSQASDQVRAHKQLRVLLAYVSNMHLCLVKGTCQ